MLDYSAYVSPVLPFVELKDNVASVKTAAAEAGESHAAEVSMNLKTKEDLIDSHQKEVRKLKDMLQSSEKSLSLLHRKNNELEERLRNPRAYKTKRFHLF